MRRVTTTYHNNGALESAGRILLTIEASESMIENYTTVIERAKNAKPGDFVLKPLALYDGGKKYTDVYENNKPVKRINYD